MPLPPATRGRIVLFCADVQANDVSFAVPAVDPPAAEDRHGPALPFQHCGPRQLTVCIGSGIRDNQHTPVAHLNDPAARDNKAPADPESSVFPLDLSGAELKRTYDGNTTTIARNITQVGFSLSQRLITANITSAPSGRWEVSAQTICTVYMRPDE